MTFTDILDNLDRTHCKDCGEKKDNRYLRCFDCSKINKVKWASKPDPTSYKCRNCGDVNINEEDHINHVKTNHPERYIHIHKLDHVSDKESDKESDDEANDEDALKKKYEKAMIEYARLSYVLNWKVNFGKHKGKDYSDLFHHENQYMNFLLSKDIIKDKVKDAFVLYSKIIEMNKLLGKTDF